jgi:quinoprotein glucose dehydrogenase
VKKKIFFSAMILIAIGLFAIREINVCNFSSFDQFKYSLKIFGKNPYINCTGDLSTYIIESKNKITKLVANLTFEDSLANIALIESSSLRTGKEIYEDFCAGCHSSGRNGAPRFGDLTQWGKISTKGMGTLIYSTKNGLNGMPPMGLCNDCTDEELKLAVEYLLKGEILTSDNDDDISLNKFYVNSPQVIAGEKIEYLSEEPNQKSLGWNRSHGNNENTKFHRTDITSDDKDKELKLKWKYDFFDVETNQKFYQENIEVNPVLYKDSLFVLGPDHRFISFDAMNGKINWELMLPPVIGMAPKRGILVERDKVFLNIGAKLFAFDYLTGKVSAAFGANGVVSGGSPTAPFIFKNNVFIVSLDGYIRGFDVDSGALVSEISYRNDNFPGNSAVPWGGVALDDRTGYVYFSTGNPKPDIVGVLRPGTNRGANTLFAINLENENIAWAFQEIQHDVWDLDLPSPPILADLKTSTGKELHVVISITKAGNTLIFDRLTGKNLHDIEWVSVNATTDIPGEILSPVQLNSSLPERLSKIEFLKEDYSLGSPEEVAAMQKFIEKSNLGYYPPHSIGRSSIIYGLHGGGEWTGGSLNEMTGQLYTPINQIPWKLRIVGKANKSFQDLSEEFKNKWSAEHQQYIKNCSQCHGENREGNILVIGEKEISYNPSLVGLFLGDASEDLIFENSFMNAHRDLNTQIDLKKIMQFHAEWDENLHSQNLIWFQGAWSRLLTKDGSLATDLPYGKIVSSNPITGKINWETTVGETKIFNSVRKGKSMFGGVASTDDGLLYVTGSNDNRLYILDQFSGKVLYYKQLSAAGSTPPTIFTVGQKTNVAVLATGGLFHNYQKKGASLYVFEH